MFGWDLPPGCTTQDCEGGPEQFCANCGHSTEFHHEEDPCDFAWTKRDGSKTGCDCSGYVEGEYEPDHNDGRDD